jgi:NhaP-type Na+/H+ or K+/H+ antiporter
MVTILAIIAFILVVAALFSGVVERAPLSFPMIFLGVGFLLGERGVGLLHITPHDASLEVIAILSLSCVLFLDALNLRWEGLGQEWLVPVLSLGPGTLLTTLLVTLAALLLLRLPVLPALLLGVVLSSVDPVLLRDVVRDERIPLSIRQSLKTEAGTNDMIVLPMLLVLTALALGEAGSAGSWAVLLADLFLLGPLAGAAVGALSVYLMKLARTRTNISREYRALYGLGVILAAYLTGEAVGGSGFLAVFTAGLAVATLDDDLCDCFLEFGEIISEMTMLLAFLMFGALLSTLIGALALLPVLAFALATLLLARPAAIGLALRKVSISRRARLFIGWFGPRGLSSLLFALLLVTNGVPGAENILAIAGVVVILSAIAHGVSATPLAARYARLVAAETLPEERESSAAGLFRPDPTAVPRISAAELARWLESDTPPIVLDVRSRSGFDPNAAPIPGSQRLLPDEVTAWAVGQDPQRAIVTYCT